MSSNMSVLVIPYGLEYILFTLIYLVFLKISKYPDFPELELLIGLKIDYTRTHNLSKKEKKLC